MIGPSLQATPTLSWQQLPTLDPDKLASWRQSLPETAIREIYGAFLTQTAQRVSGLRGQAGESAAKFSMAVHAIAGSAGMLGAARLEAACRSARAQALGSAVPAEKLRALTGEVEQALAEVREVLCAEGLAA